MFLKQFTLKNIPYFLIFIDDSISAASTSDVQDRLSALELRVQQQEDEITVLKAALADVLRRLAISEDHVASVKKSVPSKGNLSVLSSRENFAFQNIFFEIIY